MVLCAVFQNAWTTEKSERDFASLRGVLEEHLILQQAPFQYKDHLYWYGDFHYKDKTVMRPSYLYNDNPYTGKTTSLYWGDPLITIFFIVIYVSPGCHFCKCLLYFINISWDFYTIAVSYISYKNAIFSASQLIPTMEITMVSNNMLYDIMVIRYVCSIWSNSYCELLRWKKNIN